MPTRTTSRQSSIKYKDLLFLDFVQVVLIGVSVILFMTVVLAVVITYRCQHDANSSNRNNNNTTNTYSGVANDGNEVQVTAFVSEAPEQIVQGYTSNENENDYNELSMCEPEVYDSLQEKTHYENIISPYREAHFQVRDNPERTYENVQLE